MSGYRDVDGGDVAASVGMMDETSRWSATVALRAWERERLALRPGDRLLDVGCGPGDAALALAADVAPGGEVVGIDVSAAMVATASRRAASGPVRFTVGDAMALDEPDGCFDAVRSERTLQWVPDPAVAVAELARVLRPDGGRFVVIDSDWSTFRLDVRDPVLAAAVVEAFAVERRRPSNVGRRLGELARDAGLTVTDGTTATQHWTHWDPGTEPTPLGCFSMRSLLDDLVERGALAATAVAAALATIEDAARAGRFRMALTMTAVAGRSA